MTTASSSKEVPQNLPFCGISCAIFALFIPKSPYGRVKMRRFLGRWFTRESWSGGIARSPLARPGRAGVGQVPIRSGCPAPEKAKVTAGRFFRIVEGSGFYPKQPLPFQSLRYEVLDIPAFPLHPSESAAHHFQLLFLGFHPVNTAACDYGIFATKPHG